MQSSPSRLSLFVAFWPVTCVLVIIFDTLGEKEAGRIFSTIYKVQPGRRADDRAVAESAPSILSFAVATVRLASTTAARTLIAFWVSLFAGGREGSVGSTSFQGSVDRLKLPAHNTKKKARRFTARRRWVVLGTISKLCWRGCSHPNLVQL